MVASEKKFIVTTELGDVRDVGSAFGLIVTARCHVIAGLFGADCAAAGTLGGALNSRPFAGFWAKALIVLKLVKMRTANKNGVDRITCVLLCRIMRITYFDERVKWVRKDYSTACSVVAEK